jgi:hypothetical protein
MASKNHFLSSSEIILGGAVPSLCASDLAAVATRQTARERRHTAGQQRTPSAPVQDAGQVIDTRRPAAAAAAAAIAAGCAVHR